MNNLSFPLAALALLLVAGIPGARAEEPDVRLKVSNKSLGASKRGDSRTSQRQLEVQIDNRERKAFEGATLKWFVIARDINSRELSIAGSGSKSIDVPADDRSETSSAPFSFSKKEGKVERINENRPDREQFRAHPDTGTRYAGYVVRIEHDGEVIAEAATSGMLKRVAPLIEKLEKETPKKKKENR